MIEDLGYNPEKYYLGKLCPQGHDWNGTGKTLRTKGNCSCPECFKSDIYRKRKKERRDRDKHKYAEKDRLRAKAWYDAHKDLPEFKELERVRRQVNKEKYQPAKKLWTEKNKDRFIVSTNKHRAKKFGSLHIPYTPEDIKARMSEFSWCCAYCGTHLNKPTFDHFIPISKGGLDGIDNLVPCCMECNTQKGRIDPFIWMERRGVTPDRVDKILNSLGLTLQIS